MLAFKNLSFSEAVFFILDAFVPALCWHFKFTLKIYFG